MFLILLIHDLVPSYIDSLMYKNIKKLVDIKHNSKLLTGFSNEEIEDMLKFACVT